MAFLLSSSQASQQSQVSGLQIQSSVLGKVVPIIYGSTRVAGNLIDYDDFAQSGGGGKGGGKGALSGKGANNKFIASIMIALCEGPIIGYGLLWFNKSIEPVSQIFTEFLGTYPQAPWPTWLSRHPNKALGYTGIAYVAAADYGLGNSASLPNFNFEIFGALQNSAG